MTDISELIERLEANMGKADIGDVLKDCRLAAAALRQSSEQTLAWATQAAKEDDCRKLWQARALAAETRLTDTWQSIETAPKDGTDFLVLCEYARKHHQMVGCFAPNGKFVSWPGRNQYHPTHWMPLPASPDAVSSPVEGK